MNSPTTASPGLNHTDQPDAIDTPTVICIALVSYQLAAVVHEGLGHGLAAVIVEARDLRLSTAALHLDSASVSSEASRVISIAGPGAGLLLAIQHGNTRSKRAGLRYCLWLTAYVCLFANSGYLMALSLVPFGDIHGFVQGLASPLIWRLGLTVVGAVLSFVTLVFAGRTMDEFLGRTHRRARAARLIVTSYLAGSIPLILSTLLGKDGSYLTLFSAIPATLGGTIMLLYAILAVGEARPGTEPVPLTPRKSLPWYAAGAINLAVYGFVLGPGVPR